MRPGLSTDVGWLSGVSRRRGHEGRGGSGEPRRRSSNRIRSQLLSDLVEE